MAAAWVPGSSRISPQLTLKEGRSSSFAATKGTVSLPTDAEKQLVPLAGTILRKPTCLDRRRLDKAVGLAVKAAQAAGEDGRTWKEKRRRRRAKQAAKAEHETKMHSEVIAQVAETIGLLSRIRTISEYSGLNVDAPRGRFNNLSWSRASPERKALP